MNHGGVRQGAGRPPKADELKLIESMDAILAPKEVWEKLAEKVREGDIQANKLWLAYRFGQPKQEIRAVIEEVEVIQPGKPDDA